MAILSNSPLRNKIEPGTVIKISGRIGVVYSDEGPDGMLRMNCLNHELFAIRTSMLSNPIKYKVVENPPDIIMNGDKWDFVDNVVS